MFNRSKIDMIKMDQFELTYTHHPDKNQVNQPDQKMNWKSPDPD